MNKSKPEILTPINLRIVGFRNEVFIDKFVIRKLTKEQKRRFFDIEVLKKNENGLIKSFSQNNSTSINLEEIDNIEWHGSDYYISCADEIYNKENIDNLFFAFRLHKFGQFFPRYSFQEKTNDGHLSKARFFIYPRITVEENLTIYTIKQSEFSLIIDLYNSLNKFKETKKEMLLMIRERFNNAISRSTNRNNAFVDLVGILESIFLGNEKDELRFRFSLIITFVLNNFLNVKVEFAKVREFYDIRSQLTHTSKSKAYSDEKFYELVEYTRGLLKWYLENRQSSTEIFKLLHERLEAE